MRLLYRNTHFFLCDVAAVLFPLIANLSSDGNPGLSLIRSINKAAFRGYHCKTEHGCFFFSLFVGVLGLLLAHFLEGKYIIQLLLLFFSVGAISIGPVNQPELHLSAEEYRENTHRLRIMTILLVCIAVLMVLMRLNLASYCVTGLLVAAISVIAGKIIQNGRYSQCR